MQKSVNKKLIVGICAMSVALVLFSILAIMVLCDHVFWLDKFNVAVANRRTNGWTSFFKIFTHLGSFYTLAGLTLVGCLWVWFYMKKKRMSVFFLVCFATTGIANFIIKRIVRRVRPEHLMIIKETGFSFPSGHSMMSFVVFALAIYFVWQCVKNKPFKISLICLFSVLTIMVGFSRIYLGVHYLTDVLAGWLITLVIVGVFMILYNTKWFKFLKDEAIEVGETAENSEK